MPEYLCNGYDCECGQRVIVIRQDRSKPKYPSPGPGYTLTLQCPTCGKARLLTAQDIQELPHVWIHKEP